MEVRTLRQWRYHKAIGLRELAERAGVSTYTLSALEHSRSRGYPKTWRKIADALGVLPEQIAEYRAAIGLDESEPEPSDA